MSAFTDWVLSYRGYTPTELAKELADLKEQKTLYNQQRIGNQEGSIDLNELRAQIAAATSVQQERNIAPGVNSARGEFEFRGMEL